VFATNFLLHTITHQTGVVADCMRHTCLPYCDAICCIRKEESNIIKEKSATSVMRNCNRD